MNQIYLDTARLMIQAAPLVFAGDLFALKGGTAINLFIRDMPRLSVDLDLVFPEHTLPREQALNRITTRLRESAKHLNARGFQTRNVPAQDASETKLLVRRERRSISPYSSPWTPCGGHIWSASSLLEYVTFDGVCRHEVEDQAVLCLEVAMDSTHPLFQPIRIPRDVIVEKDV